MPARSKEKPNTAAFGSTHVPFDARDPNELIHSCQIKFVQKRELHRQKEMSNMIILRHHNPTTHIEFHSTRTNLHEIVHHCQTKFFKDRELPDKKKIKKNCECRNERGKETWNQSSSATIKKYDAKCD